MKKRISLTIDENLLRKIDNFVDDKKSRSEVIEEFLETYLKENRYAVILAGGNSKRLWIKELNTYRPLVRINNHTLIEDIVQKVSAIGYKNFIFIGSKEVISATKPYLTDYNVLFIEETQEKGTAATLSLAKSYLKNTFLILPCDHYFDFNLKELENIHRSENFILTLAIYAGAKYRWEKTAMVDLNRNEIVGYWETPTERKTLLTSTFIGLVEPEIFDYIGNRKSLQKDVFPLLIRKGKLGGAILQGNFVNVHSKDDVKMVKKFLKVAK